MINFQFPINGLRKKTLIFVLVFCVVFNNMGLVFAEDLDLNITANTDESDLYWQIDGRQDPQDLYKNIYKSVSQGVEKEAMQIMVEQSDFTEESIKEAMNGTFTDEFRDHCIRLLGLETKENLYKCLSILQENYEYEKQLVEFEKNLQREAEATEIWSDGDLSNSFFDVIVDLNIIEIILFGENSYEYPFAEVPAGGSESNLSVGNENGGDDEENGDGNQDDGTGTGSNVDTGNGDNSGEEGGGGNVEFVCKDPDAIALGQNVWQGSGQNQNSDTFGGSGQISEMASISQNDSPKDRGGKFIPPSSNDNCGDPESQYFSEGAVSLYHGLLCTDPWPCDDIFCVRVSEVLQDVDSGGGGNTNGSAKENSVQGIVSEGIKQLNWLKGHNLTIKENSNERFFPSVSKFFKQVPGLDVIVQNFPVKFKAESKGTAFDKDSDLTKEVLDVVLDIAHNDNDLVQGAENLEKIIYKNSRVEDYFNNLCEETMLDCKANGDIVFKEAERTIKKQSEVGSVKNDTWSNILLNQESLKSLYEKTQKAWEESKKFQYQKNFWEEIKDYLNMTVTYFQTMEGLFVKMNKDGKEILEKTGQPCK